MAGHLQAVGHSVTVYNRTPARAEAWVAQHGGTSAESPAAAAEGAEFVMVCVGNDADVRAVTTGKNGVLETMRERALLIDHTTASADLAVELHSTAAARSVGFVDAPVSGGQAGAENGVLTVMCGGNLADFESAATVIDAYARSCQRLGGPGAGQLTKMVNQICIAGLIQGLSEGLNFAQLAGLNVDEVVATISKGAAGSWQMENRSHTMAERHFDHGFAVDWMHKDLHICLEQGERIGAHLPVTALVDQYYARLQNQGHGRWDSSSLIELLRDCG